MADNRTSATREKCFPHGRFGTAQPVPPYHSEKNHNHHVGNNEPPYPSRLTPKPWLFMEAFRDNLRHGVWRLMYRRPRGSRGLSAWLDPVQRPSSCEEPSASDDFLFGIQYTLPSLSTLYVNAWRGSCIG
jgi:hypothetical protein